MATKEQIDAFLNANQFAVAGASAKTHKYGYKVFRSLIESGRETYPINPMGIEIDGHVAYKSLTDLPSVPQSLSIITPSAVTKQIVDDAIEVGVQNIWMQPGAEEESASQAARAAGINVIDDGACVLVLLAQRDL